MNKKPAFSVILPVFNGGQFVSNAIDDLTNQSYQNFEIIIINDGSTDDTLEIVSGYSARKNIRIIDLATNTGHSNALNIGINYAANEWISIADADDRYSYTKLENQVSFIEQNKDVSLFGGHCKIIGSQFGWPVYLSHSQILCGMVFRNQFVHPSLVFNRRIIECGHLYNTDYKRANDYEFTSNVIKEFTCGNGKEIVLNYKLTPSEINDVQFEEAAKVKLHWLTWLGLNPSETELDLHLRLSTKVDSGNVTQRKHLAQWCLHLIETVNKHQILQGKVFRRVLLNELKLNCPEVIRYLPKKLTLLNWLY